MGQFSMKNPGHLWVEINSQSLQFPEDGDVTSADFSGGEQPVRQPLEALGFQFTEVDTDSGNDLADHFSDVGSITSEDVRLIASSRSKQKYVEISDDERAAYTRRSG
jgi:hypothetical protein